MPKSKLQHSEIRLGDFEGGWAIVEPTRKRTVIQLQLNTNKLALVELSPEEAHVIGRALIEHAVECGYDPDTGETTPPEG